MEHKYEKKYEIRGKTLRYLMPKELDHHVAQPLCRELDMLIESFGVRELELDFAGTEFMDSSGIGVVIGRSKTMQFRGGKVSVVHLDKRVAMIFESIGLQKLVEVKEDVCDGK
jgi:stage II sporulation protein AA (anti-sigma F factor antagonist)